ncbi:cation transport protein-domain-containing protein [Xylariaceae sp. FL1019]|nr:cation transport protein-domain-containing protein [Xylariaceae sp. FL1019]
MGLKWWHDFREQHPELCETWETRWALIRPYLPPVNFITLHYAYFIVTAIIGTLVFWGSSAPRYSIGWWDSLFMVMSALTASGLNTVNVSQLTTFQQVQLCVFMIMGSQVTISYVTIAFRKHIFEKRFEDIVETERAKRKATTSKTGAIVGMTGAMVGLQVMSSFGKSQGRKQGQSSRPWSSKRDKDFNVQPLSTPDGPTTSYPQAQNNAATGTPGGDERDPPQQQHIGFLEPIREGRPQSATTGNSIYQTQSHQTGNTARQRPQTTESGITDAGFNVQTFVKEQKGNIGRNGQFFNLSDEQREYLGGVEYRALKFLSGFVIVYVVLWQLLGAIALGAWMSVYAVDDSAVNAQNPWWAGVFLAISSYNNAGFTLLDAGFIPFQGSYFLLIVVTILSLAGPAAFPVFMRLLIWIMSKVFHFFTRDPEDYTLWKEGFDFILRFPRRVYTSLFPSRDTWLFVATFGGFVLADWVLILVLTTGNPTMDALPVGQRVFDALFEGFSIPSGGYAIVSPSALYFDVLVLWLVIFYTAAYPHIITMRKTNVYEERSLGIYEGDQTEIEQLHSETSSLFDVDADAGPKNHPELGATSGFNVDGNVKRRNWDAASETPSAMSGKRLYAAGRRGTAFVGRQLQRRMTAFQGVGVAHATTPVGAGGPGAGPAIPPLRRAVTIDFARPLSTHSLQNHTPAGPPSLVSQQVRGQLSHDVWWVALALFLVTLIETRHSLEDPVTFSVFNMLFEIVSGYTNIGISIGLPDQSYSLTGGMYTGSKIIMVLVMLRGRHRGLPVALDRAVRLPGKHLAELEDEDAEIRSLSAFSR